jgi:hypothetical protein
MKLENVFQYIKLKRIASLPTWQAEFQGQVRYNEATDRLALAGPSAWDDITTLTDVSTPTITDFTNATHTHLSNSEGGQLSNYATFGPFVLNDVPGTANTDMSAQFMDTGTTVSQSTGHIYMPRNGEVVGIYATADANRTAGTATFVPTINGTAQTLDGGATCVLDGTNTRRHSVHVATGDGENFSSGDRVGIQCQTSSWTPTTADAIAWFVVRLDF